MTRILSAGRGAPVIAGLAGLAWFWFELAPQRAGFPDTDDPSMGLAFINAHPTAWPVAGLALGVAAVALVVTILALRARLAASAGAKTPGASGGVAVDALAVVGLIACAMLLGMAAVRMSGGPVRYIQGIDQAWGETAYLVTQFVGMQALLTGGLVLLELWLVGVAVLGVRRGVLPRLVAVLAVLPGLRLVGVLGPFGVEFEGGWFLLIVAIPATFAWLTLLGLTIRAPSPLSAGDTLAGGPVATIEGGGHLGKASA